jgi:hypothetical protein
MHLHKLLLIIFLHTSLAMLQLPYPKQTFQLPNHPSNWMCTVHITVATFANKTSSDIAERFLASNRENLIPVLSTMVNRSINIAPVISFFEPCTVSILIDATVQGLSYVFREERLFSYINGNEYVYRGWRHSVIILMHFSCYSEYTFINLHLPHRLFYHSLDCGDQNIFPNKAFVPNTRHPLRNINDPTHNIHHQQLPLSIRRSISTPRYRWDRHDPNIKPGHCLASRWQKLSQMASCQMVVFAVHHYQKFLNFTAVANTQGEFDDYGMLITHSKRYDVEDSISLHAIDSTASRILYCDRNSDSPRLRPISLSSPFSFETWVILVLLLISCAIVSSFTIFDLRLIANNLTTVKFIKTIFNSFLELIMCMLEKDVGKNSCTKAFIGLTVICLGNTYKNYLTIDLVFPRAGDAIRNLTELLDLNFNVLQSVVAWNISQSKSSWLKQKNFHLEIEETRREKYIREAERWLKLITDPEEKIINQLASVTSKNAWIISAPYFIQVYYLNLISERNHPLACHLVKRPFAYHFRELYYFNPRAEEFKWWTGKFLDHGLFEFWKRLDSHQLTLNERRRSKAIRLEMSNSSSTEALDLNDFIAQVHLSVFYLVISILTIICIVIFLFECAMQNIQQLSLFALTKFKYYSLLLLWTIIRSLFLMSRRIWQLYEHRNPWEKRNCGREPHLVGFKLYSYKIEVRTHQDCR